MKEAFADIWLRYKREIVSSIITAAVLTTIGVWRFGWEFVTFPFWQGRKELSSVKYQVTKANKSIEKLENTTTETNRMVAEMLVDLKVHIGEDREWKRAMERQVNGPKVQASTGYHNASYTK